MIEQHKKALATWKKRLGIEKVRIAIEGKEVLKPSEILEEGVLPELSASRGCSN